MAHKPSFSRFQMTMKIQAELEKKWLGKTLKHLFTDNEEAMQDDDDDFMNKKSQLRKKKIQDTDYSLGGKTVCTATRKVSYL